MKWGLLSDMTSQALVVALRGTAARQGALSNNIANVDTPGFVRTEIQFEEALASALKEARRAPSAPGDFIHASPVRRREDHASPRRADGNNVNIELEMTELARNALAHQAAGELLANRIRLLRAVIRGNRTG